MQVVFRSTAIALFPDVMEDGSGEEITEAIDPDDVEIDRVICANLGQEHFRPHLIVSRRSSEIASPSTQLGSPFFRLRFFSPMVP